MKRIVICADGTWNRRDQVDKKTRKRRPTNVTKLARAVLPRDQYGTYQVVYYHAGVGTGKFLDKYTGGAFGDGIEENIRDLYRFIVYNYYPDDEIFLFVFSRGAFTVRSLAGFMNKVGLLQKDDDFFVPELYDCYENAKGPETPEWKKAFEKVRHPRPCPPIKFIGVWDTVGALGAPGLLGQIFNRKKYQYHDVTLNANIENAVQALAIDERRKPFLPSVWAKPAGWTGKCLQAWFPGVHSNVGGGYAPDGIANEPLHWLISEAEALGLQVDPAYLAYFRPCFNTPLEDSMTLLYRAMGPVTRPIGDQGESVHQATVDREGLPTCAYDPPNLKAYAARAGQLSVVTTPATRISRGKPC